MEPEEVAGPLLEFLNSLPARAQLLNRHNFFQNPEHTFGDYPAGRLEEVAGAYLAAWMWLEREGLLLPKVGHGSSDWMAVSSRGKRFAGAAKFREYRSAGLLPAGQLHPAIVAGARQAFIRGAYDTAVFESFREVEVAVRRATGSAPEDIGSP